MDAASLADTRAGLAVLADLAALKPYDPRMIAARGFLEWLLSRPEAVQAVLQRNQ
jgi:hypothetical protein